MKRPPLSGKAVPKPFRYWSFPAAFLVAAIWAASWVGCNHSSADAPVAEQSKAFKPVADIQPEQLDEVIDFVERERLLKSDVHAAWQILHGVLAYGRGFEIEHEGERVEALPWVMGGGNMTGWVLRKGEVGVRAVVEPGTQTGQGHEDQWLSIISQAGLASSEPVVAGGQSYTLSDLIKQSMWDTWEGKEASWSLMALSYYLPLDATWTARDGSSWSFEKLIAMEAGQDIPSSACGGTHRLSAMKAAIRRFQAANPGVELSDGWLQADKKINEAISTARNWQQEDGAFSANILVRPGKSSDMTANLYASGHMFEFLAGAVEEPELAAPWMVRGAHYICELLHRTRELDMECGALYHAVHGLILYRDRRFGKRPLQQYRQQEQNAPSSEPAESTTASGQ